MKGSNFMQKLRDTFSSKQEEMSNDELMMRIGALTTYEYYNNRKFRRALKGTRVGAVLKSVTDEN